MQPTAFSDAELRQALEGANLPSLLPALATLTGQARWLEPPFRPTSARGLSEHDDAGLDEQTRAQVLGEAFDVLTRWRDGDLVPAPAPSPETLVDWLSASLGERLPDDYGQLIGEELGLYPRASVPSTPPVQRRPLHVLVIGAGASGLCLALRLVEAGIDFTVVEKNDDVGGTWHENTYPGCGVDTPSHLYSLSNAPRTDWTRYFAGRDELAAYWRSLADRPGVRERIRFSTEVSSAHWDEDAAQWRVEVRGADGTVELLEADALVSAVGLLNRPSLPAIPGLADFGGPVLHTAQWDPDTELAGKRVAVIGTGASAMQLVPAVAGTAERVTVFQRSPQWAMPHPLYRSDVPAAVTFLNRHVPWYQAFYRARLFWRMGDKLHGLLQRDPDFAHPDRAINAGNDKLRQVLTAHIERELADHPDLLAKSLPTYPPYGKRLLVDNGWFATLRRDDVELVTDAVTRVTPSGVVTADGTEHPADVIALATGFRSVEVLGALEVTGRDGVSLHEVWGEDDGRAYLGITVPGFPNFFCLYGPNTNTGHGGTVLAGTEMQVQHVTALLAHLVDEDLASVEVSQEAFDAYEQELSAALDRTIWTHPGMSTYYRNSKGRVVTNSPWQYVDYWRRVHEPDLGAFVTRPRTAALSSTGSTS